MTSTWSSSNTATATVSATGLVTGKAAGAVTISAVFQGVTGMALIFVFAPPPPLPFTCTGSDSLRVATGRMTATLDGATWQSDCTHVDLTSVSFLIVGNRFSDQSSIGIAVGILSGVGPIGPGTFGPGSAISGGVKIGLRGWLAVSTLNGGTQPLSLTIDTLTPTNASGTFFLTATPNPAVAGVTGTKVVINGVFDLMF
jgi:hypothetical protein